MKSKMHFVMSAVLFLSLLLIMTSVPGTAQQLKSNQIQTNLKGAFTTAAPPEGFDPRTASDQELAYYGFPPRPDAIAAPQAFARWQRAMTGARKRIVPNLQLTNMYHGPAKAASSVSSSDCGSTTTALNSKWSGYVVCNEATSYTASSTYAISAEYVVPVAQQAFGPSVCADMVYEFTWVGIDGYSASPNEVLQAGTQSDTTCTNGVTGAAYASWYEWYPYAETLITNLPTAPGDDFYVEIWNTSSTMGSAYLLNRTANLEASVTFSAKPGFPLIGNSFEWIIERPTLTTGPATLANYISEPFTEAIAWNYITNSSILYPSNSSAIAITMLDDSGNPISYPTLLGEGAFVMQDEGSALGTATPVP